MRKVAVAVLIIILLGGAAYAKPPKHVIVKSRTSVRTSSKSAHKPAKKAAKPKKAPTLPKFVPGKGVWLYLYDQCENGEAKKIAKRAHDQGLDYILVKTHDGSEWQRKMTPERLKKIVKECHKLNVRVYGWGYVYLKYPDKELAREVEAAQCNLDGFVWNAEKESRNRRVAASQLCSAFRKYVDKINKNPKRKNKMILAYSTFCRINMGIARGVPYDIFNQFSDVCMPQLYWVDFRGWTEANAAYRMMVMWQEAEKQMGCRAKPIIPTLHAYADTGNTSLVPPEDLAKVAKSLGGYYGINFYVWEKMGSQHWKVVKNAPGGLAWQYQHNAKKAWAEVAAAEKAAKAAAHARRLAHQRKAKHSVPHKAHGHRR